MDDLGVPHAFGHHLHGTEDGVDLLAAAQSLADGVVAGMLGGARHDQVAHAGQSAHGFGRSAVGHDKASHLGKSPRNQRRARVVAETHAVRTADGDGEHVFHRAADFHADGVAGGVDAERGAGPDFLHAFGGRLVRARRDDRGRYAARDFLGMCGPGERDDIREAQNLLGELGHALVGLFAKPFRQRDHELIVCYEALETFRHRSEILGGRGEHDDVGARNGRGAIARQDKRLRQRDALQELVVPPRAAHLIDVFGECAPKRDRVPVAGEQKRVGGSPAAVSDNCDLHRICPIFSRFVSR